MWEKSVSSFKYFEKIKANAERTKNEVIITVSVGSSEPMQIQAILNYVHYKELTSKIRKLDQKEIDKFFRDIKKSRPPIKAAKSS